MLIVDVVESCGVCLCVGPAMGLTLRHPVVLGLDYASFLRVLLHLVGLVYTFTTSPAGIRTPTLPLLLWLHQGQLFVSDFVDSGSDCGLVACASFQKGIGEVVLQWCRICISASVAGRSSSVRLTSSGSGLGWLPVSSIRSSKSSLFPSTGSSH